MLKRTSRTISKRAILIAVLVFQSLMMWCSPAVAQSEGSNPNLGRLALSTTIAPVLVRAELEAIAVFTSEMASFYNLDFPDIVAEFRTNAGKGDYFESPLQNLALFRDLLIDGKTNLSGVSDNDTGKLLAVFLGVAADRPINEEIARAVVSNLSRGLKQPLSVDLELLSVDAETVRSAIQEANN